ncbi:cell surface A33 antigen [Bombina bombina]|uniref:cell surface A33 antigen n=1 Tax=Bombina bombina TaxID=8345 RepID=UPI00235AF51C|nr:cell surface A33 antigen [Bombina bombina]
MRLWRREAVTLIVCTVLTSISAIVVQTPTKVVESARGQSAVLPCKYQTSTIGRKSGSVEWKRLPSQEEVTILFFNDITTNGSNYQDRVSFNGNVNADDATITINQLRMEDNGTYQCDVKISTDRQGTSFASLDLVVLVAPTKPNCGIAGTAEYGQVITLTCASSEGSPIPDYSWKSFSPDNQERQLPLTSERVAGGLTLKNISMDTSGFFICTAKNKVGSDFCNLTLAVMPPSMNIAFYAGIIGGSVGGIIVLGIIAYCCCCRDKDKGEYDYEMPDKDQEEDDEDVEERKVAQQKQRYDYNDDEEIDDEEDQRRAGPPKPPSNKPRLVMNSVDA